MALGAERREHPRVYFVDGYEVSARVYPGSSGQEPVMTRLLSLSEGGLSFMTFQGVFDEPQIDEQLHLEGVLRPENLLFLQNVGLQVRHHISGDAHQIIGCRFIDPGEDLQHRLRGFIFSYLERIRHRP